MEFQSTLPRGSDVSGLSRKESFAPFQSTLPRGSDVSEEKSYSRFLDFNPRSLAGATQLRQVVIPQHIISIHAPSRERPHTNVGFEMLLDFNPRSLAGATTSPYVAMQACVFQSTLPRGSDIFRIKPVLV